MKRLIFAHLGIFLCLITSYGQNTQFFPGGNICSDQPWKLVFHDEFNGDSVDVEKWYRYYPSAPGGMDTCQDCRTHGNEGQIYVDSNVIVSGGTLKLTAKRPDSAATWMGATRGYTSGMIHSKINNFLGGRYEIRCKIPSGMGFWPAFWTFGGGDEIDIFEFGGQVPTKVSTNVHEWFQGGSNSSGYSYSDGTNYSNGFHIFAIEWDEYFLKWLVDGKVIRKLPKLHNINGAEVSCTISAGTYVVNNLFPTGATSVILNLAIGNEDTPFTGSPTPSTTFPNIFEIDYIRIWQREPQAGFVDLCAKNIKGPDVLCDTINYTYNFVGKNKVKDWKVSNNLKIISKNGNSVVVRPKQINGKGWVQAILFEYMPCPDTLTTKNIWIGKPEASVNVSDYSQYCQVFLDGTVRPNIGNIQSYYVITKNGVSDTIRNWSAVIEGSHNVATLYSWQFVNQNICGKSYVNGNGIIEKCNKLELRVSPNPAIDEINITISGDLTDLDVENISIVSNEGEVFQLPAPKKESWVNVYSLNEGLYTVVARLRSYNLPLTKSFMIQRP